MTTNIAKLKKGKGRPPASDLVPDVMAQDTRKPSARPPSRSQTEGGITRPLQVRIPTNVFEAFSEQAGREFGFTHGAKKRLFLKMWESYRHESMQK